MNKLITESQMVNKTIQTYITTTTSVASNSVIKRHNSNNNNNNVKNVNRILSLKNNNKFEKGPPTSTSNNILYNLPKEQEDSMMGMNGGIGKRQYSIYNLKSYPFYHATKNSEDLISQKKYKYQVASSHGNNGNPHDMKTEYFKNRKYHKKNEIKHSDSFDNKPIFPHILKNNEMKTVSELKEDYRRMVEESRRTAPKYESKKTQDKMKEFSLGID